MTAVICTREELPAASDPRSIAAAQLHRDRTHSASLTHDARGVSPEFRAFEEKFRQMGAEQIPEHNHGPQYLAMIKEGMVTTTKAAVAAFSLKSSFVTLTNNCCYPFLCTMLYSANELDHAGETGIDSIMVTGAAAATVHTAV